MTGLARALGAVVGAAHLRAGPPLIVAPDSTDQVVQVLRLCAAHGVSVVPEGGQTGLVGGTVAAPDQVVISLRRMVAIEAIYPDERVMTVQAGTPLQAVQEAALAHALEPGIDLAARGTATIGGMVATNAGGIMAHRYGVMRHRVLGLEAVLPDGQVYSDLTRVVKNTAGYDLKHLFIGAEGTLGIVTRVVLKLEPVPVATVTMLLGLPSVAAALQATSLAMRAGHGHLRAAEALWTRYITLTANALGWAEPSFPLSQPVNLILMLGGAAESDLMQDAEAIFAQLADDHPDTTGIIAQSARQAAALWRLREDTEVIYRAHPGAPSYDISVPLTEITGFLERVLPALATLDGGIFPYVFGHLADGNLHIVLDRTGPMTPALSAAVEAVLYPPLAALGGSFSAEHGVGSKRVAALQATAPATKLALMGRVKHALDPGNLMNPGKVLPCMQSEAAR
ncbi:MAG: FAD-binding oxidoreductase [Paracoccaceae bacterium]